jgi:hypothetical protein
LEGLANPPEELMKEKDKASKTSAVIVMLIFAAGRKGYIHLYQSFIHFYRFLRQYVDVH